MKERSTNLSINSECNTKKIQFPKLTTEKSQSINNLFENETSESEKNVRKYSSPCESNSKKRKPFLMKKLSQEFRKNILSLASNKMTKFNHVKDPSSKIFFENNKFKNCFTNIEKIGEGGQGEVFKAMHKLEGHYYAIKKISLQVRNHDEL